MNYYYYLYYFYSLLEVYMPVKLFFVMFKCFQLKYIGIIALFLFFTVVSNWVSRIVEFHWYWYRLLNVGIVTSLLSENIILECCLSLLLLVT